MIDINIDPWRDKGSRPRKITIMTGETLADALHSEATERGVEMSVLASAIWAEVLAEVVERIEAKRRDKNSPKGKGK